ncbi:MAG: gluconate 2-dehydrogenase subunit 3 family protein [Cytophagaceae bacterium]|nr:gluconate 2-dehydrogenase subunit 3 family protein [Gemmatimonadaceae bacterium]
MSSTRRTFITSAAGLGAAWLATDWALVDDALAHAAKAVAQQPAPSFTTLTAAEAREVDAMAQRILPTTNTPGAKEAGVIYFIDKAMASFEKDALLDLRKGLTDLRTRVAKQKKGATSFASLAPTEQDAVLRGMEKTDFFGLVHYLTMVGMFGNPSYGGNRDRIGWKIIGFDPQAVHQPPFGYYDAQLVRGKKA